CKEDIQPNGKKLPVGTFPMQEVTLNNLSTFKEAKSNWLIAGDVYADRNVDRAIEVTDGEGILVNVPDDNNKDNLFTDFEHVDIDLELEVMMPKSSNSGIYLMSRYEVQLLDSWGIPDPKHGDMGGIYQRWDESKPEGEKGFDGISPLTNAAKAPGLWQHFRIVFKAPRFDSNGKKTANAMFKEVYLNGTLVQQNIEVSGPTRGAAFGQEVSSAPLMLQGDHGPVAFRNIKYRSYNGKKVILSEMKVSQYKSIDDTIREFLSQTPVLAVNTDSISFLQATQPDQYLLLYEGNITIPDEGEYFFTLQLDGGGYFVIAEDTIINYDYYHSFADKAIAKTKIKAGTFPFKLIYNKPSRRWRKGLALFAEGKNIARHPLHAPSSIHINKPKNPIYISASESVITQRSFMMHGDEKRTHVISVGSPIGIHYSYALETGTFLQAWHGGFLDATPMWFERGPSQLSEPLGPEIEFHSGPTIAFLKNKDAIWPDSIQKDIVYKQEGYELDDFGYPTYKMKVEEVVMSDKVLPNKDNHQFTRNIHLDNATSDTYVKLAEGKNITLLPDGTYAVDDKKYYLGISKSDGGNILVRETGKIQELLFKAENAVVDIIYETIW
ncbi:MAG: DUF1080 domain-containing protein, partial [Bacteroidota bacterium]